ncbi:MAG: tRNA (N(6)-L-threonylcarbamoyladenosine(37)-C(2))-methylthiotransferase MtaB [Dehalococcoidia bacterium]|nr:tRNA (N(6)-L-threonylcarbamoyladenosine(37)-C(2))-methylthiotransferase MtaB [Dehalococcoidia bacterium]
MKISLETLGCKLNQAETEALTREFAVAGHELVTGAQDADIYILNTCTVTHTADSKSRHLLRQARRRNPNALIIATGCYADRTPLELAKLDEVDRVIGNESKSGIVARLEEEGLITEPVNTRPVPASELKPGMRTRAFIKIQDGCRNFCAYCIVPYVRRQEKSTPVEEIIAQVRQRIAEGYQEVVLTGTRIGAYDAGGLNLKDLVEHILKETEIPRLRLSSLQPREIAPALLALWQDKRLCPHFHLSLQSGNAGVLQRMRRRYTLTEYELAVALIRQMVPDVAITTDVIVGFPGETDVEFEESLEFCRGMDFARIHVFPFSPRKGTEASQMPGQVPEKVKKERTRQMLNLAVESAARFREKYTGATLDVLWEKETGKGVWSGMTGNYLRVYKKDSKDLGNKRERVKLEQ